MTSSEIFGVQQAAFADTVHDAFGQSILNQIFEPLGAELAGLSGLDEVIQAGFAEINARAQEAASIL
jgi:hypothetical protein